MSTITLDERIRIILTYGKPEMYYRGKGLYLILCSGVETKLFGVEDSYIRKNQWELYDALYDAMRIEVDDICSK